MKTGGLRWDNLSLAAILLTVILAGCLGGAGNNESDDSTSTPTSDTIVRVEEICFATQVPAIGPAMIRGERYAQDEATTAILLLHGAAITRGAWTGEFGGPNLAFDLAEAGYAVFVIDRLGYGASPWSGAGRSGVHLDHETQVATSHDVVQAIRAGAGRIVLENGTCAEASADGRTFENVVYGGHSYGGIMSIIYGARYDDVDALIPFAFYLLPFSEAFGNHVNACRTVLASADGYTNLFCDAGDAVAPCTSFMFHADNTTPEAMEAGCQAIKAFQDPIMLLHPGSNHLVLREEVKRIPAGLPVLRAAVAHDGVWETGDATAAREEDLALWQDLCACTVSELTLDGSGHLWNLHDSAPSLAGKIIAWLAEVGL